MQKFRSLWLTEEKDWLTEIPLNEPPPFLFALSLVLWFSQRRPYSWCMDLPHTFQLGRSLLVRRSYRLGQVACKLKTENIWRWDGSPWIFLSSCKQPPIQGDSYISLSVCPSVGCLSIWAYCLVDFHLQERQVTHFWKRAVLQLVYLIRWQVTVKSEWLSLVE